VCVSRVLRRPEPWWYNGPATLDNGNIAGGYPALVWRPPGLVRRLGRLHVRRGPVAQRCNISLSRIPGQIWLKLKT
jgi:hypothetical protein